MTDSLLESKAKAFATNAHKGQKRKYTGEPYITHPAAVAELVRSVYHTEEMLAAAWLHDVCEDCGVSNTEIMDKFGQHVGRMVARLTDRSRPSDGPRSLRKAIDRVWIAGALHDTMTIKLADIIDNSRSILEHDPAFAKVYLPEKRALLKVLLPGADDLWHTADKICRSAGYP